MATIDERKIKYSEIYTKVLTDTMAKDTPYDKFTAELREYYEKYGLNNDRRFEMMCNALVAMTQTVTTSSQQIALQMLIEHDRLELEAKNADADIALKQKQLIEYILNKL